MSIAPRVPGLFSKERVYYEKCKRLGAQNARLREELESRRELGRIDHKRISHLEAAIEEARAPNCWMPRDDVMNYQAGKCISVYCVSWREKLRKQA